MAEESLLKLEWFPTYPDRFLSSPAWRAMKDYHRGWYFQLLLESTRSERLGYLRDDENLWRIAGAHSRPYWEERKAVVMARFESCQYDGSPWIYNPQLLLVMEEQSKRYVKRKPPPSLLSPVISDVDLGKTPSNEGFDGAEWFKRIIREHPRPERGHEAQVAVMESILWVLGQGIRETRLAAAEYVLERTQLYKQCTRNWPDKSKITGAARWYRGQMFEQDAEIWGASRQEQCLKHPESGLTPTGGCWSCYAEAHG